MLEQRQDTDRETVRRAQLQMAQQIVRAIAQKAELMAEAGHNILLILNGILCSGEYFCVIKPHGFESRGVLNVARD